MILQSAVGSYPPYLFGAYLKLQLLAFSRLTDWGFPALVPLGIQKLMKWLRSGEFILTYQR